MSEEEAIYLLFRDLSAKIHKNYNIDFRSFQGSKDLIVVFSPNTRFSLYKYKFDKNVIFLADKRLNYYMVNPGRQTKLIFNFASLAGFTRVIFLGSSKGGTGALLWSSLFLNSINHHNIKVSCLAFSPQTLLYPYNDNLTFPSYRKVYEQIGKSDLLKTCFTQYGDIGKFVENGKVPTTIFYSSGYSVDTIEAERISSQHVIHVKIPLPFHGSITPFLIDRKDPGAIDRLTRKLFLNSSKDEDLKASIPSSFDQLYGILDAINVSQLDRVIEAFS